ncbi:hypothetical protein Tco_0433255 [Tanacetum coccineum]
MVAATEPTTIQKDVQIASTLTDEAIRNRSIKKILRREEIGENLARIGMEGMITRELGLEMLLLQPQIMLEREHGNGYLRKGRKTKPKRQNRTRNGKAWRRHSQIQAQV